MATGYTWGIREGCTFKEFVLNCATAFAYDVTKFVEKEPSDYHKKELKKAKERLKEVEKMTLAEATVLVKKNCFNNNKMHKEMNEDARKIRGQYEKMLRQVMAWNPPSSKHVKLKEFMIEQIEASIDHDCDDTWTEDKEPQTGEEYLENDLSYCKRQVEYHEKEWKEEVERVNGNNNWIRQLNESMSHSKEGDNE